MLKIAKRHRYLVTDKTVWKSVVRKLTAIQAEELRNHGFWVEEITA